VPTFTERNCSQTMLYSS